jgi:hypothetical protein
MPQHPRRQPAIFVLLLLFNNELHVDC